MPVERTNTPFSHSGGVFSWLSRFINLERGQNIKALRLDRMRALAGLAGHPERCAPVIHVAGSKGKGSVTGMISAILEAAGYSPARYTSPHVTEYRERITAGSHFFEEPVYCEAGDELVAITGALAEGPQAELFSDDNQAGGEPTFFELLTLYFFLCARRARCDVMVVETGMGGRLDATNIVDPLVSVITTIELEHTEYLGKTIGAIAGEKAGIIKPQRPLILSEQSPEALKVFRETAASRNAPLYYFPDMALIEDLSVQKEGTSYTLKAGSGGSTPFLSAPLHVSIPIPGEIQAKNGGLALLAVKTAFPEAADRIITGRIAAKALGNFTLPARFERIGDDPAVIIDGAHTPTSVDLCVKTFTTLYGEGGILLFGCAAGKDAETMAEFLIPHFSRIIITTPGSFKVSYPDRVYETFQKALRGREDAAELELSLISDTGAAIRRAFDLGREQNLPVLGVGSFYLAAEIRREIPQAKGGKE
jgi:dihydrofolate synthase/folylpolyglutamate synthase